MIEEWERQVHKWNEAHDKWQPFCVNYGFIPKPEPKKTYRETLNVFQRYHYDMTNVALNKQWDDEIFKALTRGTKYEKSS